MGINEIFMGLTMIEALTADENRHSYLSDNPFDDILFEEFCKMGEKYNDLESEKETC